MATALANNSPIPRRSNTVPHPTSNTEIGTSNPQQQNIPATQSLDDKVEQLLVRSRSPMGKDDARRMSELLDKILSPHHPILLRTRRRCYRELVRLCGEHGILPKSYMIPELKIRKLTETPVSTGGFSYVWRGMYNEEKRVAIKAIRYYESDNVQQIRKGFCREVITWRRLSHPNILKLVGVVMNESEFIMVAPWMENGNIVNHVRKDPHANPLKLLEDATRGLMHLHSVDLAHGDLKGANILVSDAGHACLADVGLTRVAGDLNSTTAASNTSSSGGEHTLRWCPPELLDPERFGFKKSNPTKKSDIYSMAMTIYEVLTDKVPFHGFGDLVVMYHIIGGVRPAKPNSVLTRGYTEKLWEMTTSCWIEVATERPTVDHVLEVLEAAAKWWRPRSFDGEVDQLLAKTWLCREDDLVRKMAGALDKVLHPHFPITPRTRRRCFQGLVKFCEEHDILPTSYIIPESKIEKLGDTPVFSSRISDIWPGAYEGDTSVAIKVIRYSETDDIQQFKRDFRREVINWKRLSHPNVLEFVGVTMNDRECVMVSSWMEYGTVVDCVKGDPQINPLELLEDATRGLKYLHALELAHGGLRAANILVSEEGHACLTGFKLTWVAEDSDPDDNVLDTSPNSGRCALPWCAPELLDPERFGFKRSGPTKESDIYSMGMTIYEVMTDKIPVHGQGETATMPRIPASIRPQKPIFASTRGYTEELWKLTTSCWNEAIADRPTADQVLEALKASAKHWKPMDEGCTTDDRSPTPCVEPSPSIPSKPDDGFVTTDPFPSHGTQSPVISTSVPAPSSPPASHSPIPPPSTAKNETASKYIMATPGEDETRPSSTSSLQKGEEPETLTEEVIKPPPVAEIPVTSQEDTQRTLISPTETQPMSSSTSYRRRDEANKTVSARSIPIAPREANHNPVGSIDPSPQLVSGSARNRVARHRPVSPREERLSSEVTFAFSSGGCGDDHSPTNRHREEVGPRSVSTTPEEGAKVSPTKLTSAASPRRQVLKPQPVLVERPNQEKFRPIPVVAGEVEVQSVPDRSSFRDLVEVCEEYGILPRSCIAPGPGVRELDAPPVSSGGFSRVWKGEYGEKRETVAIKALRHCTTGVQGIKKKFCREAIIWKHLSHSNVLQFIGAIMNDQKCVMISPWMEGGTIVEFLKRNYYNPLELLEGAAQGLQYLHGMDLVHGDLKGANILVSEGRRPFLADFGHVVFEGDLSRTPTAQKSTCVGTPRWCPPELFDRRELGFSWDSPTKKSDIYSMAMTIHEVLTGAPPFYGHGKIAATNRIICGERPPEPIFSDTRGYTPELWETTTRCWKQEPAERPAVGDMLYALKTAVGQWNLSPPYNWIQAPSSESGSPTQATTLI